MFVLDTDHVTLLQHESGLDHDRLVERLGDAPRGSVFVTVISFQEQVAGWNAYVNSALRPEEVVHGYRMLQSVLDDFAKLQILPFDDAASQWYQTLRQRKVRTKTLDLRIASIALSRGMTVVTRNTVDFARVPGLMFEDWTADDGTNGSH